MIERIFHRLDLLTRRERLLLLMLVWIALPLAVVFAVILPLNEARRVSVARAAEAGALHRWVIAQAGSLPAGALDAPTDPGGNSVDENNGPIGISRLEQTLKSAGLRQHVARLANRAGNGVEIDFDPVPFDQLTGWLEVVMGSWGYSITGFRFEKTEFPGLVTAGFVLEPRP